MITTRAVHKIRGNKRYGLRNIAYINIKVLVNIKHHFLENPLVKAFLIVIARKIRTFSCEWNNGNANMVSYWLKSEKTNFFTFQNFATEKVKQIPVLSKYRHTLSSILKISRKFCLTIQGSKSCIFSLYKFRVKFVRKTVFLALILLNSGWKH